MEQGEAQPQGRSGTVVLIMADTLGRGVDELGGILMRSFVKALAEAEPPPGAMLFLNSGVRLTTEGSELLGDLGVLAGRGVAIRSCGTCLDYFKLREKLRVGDVTDMRSTVATLLAADRVIRP